MKHWENILRRKKDGTHKNAGFAYHEFSRLREMLPRKNQLIECYRLRGLKQSRKLLEKATALSDQKRLLMAMASGKASRFDRLISLGLRQKKKGGPWVVGFIFGRGRWILQPKDCYGGGRYESVALLKTGGKLGGRDQSSSEQCTERLIPQDSLNCSTICPFSRESHSRPGHREC